MYKTDGRFEKLHAPQFISGEPEKQRVGRLGGNRCSFACTQRLRPCDHNQEPENAKNSASEMRLGCNNLIYCFLFLQKNVSVQKYLLERYKGGKEEIDTKLIALSI